MITIDSQIWIYYWDSNALEHPNTMNWMKGKNKNGILFKEKIILSSIIPIEIGHNLYRLAYLRKDLDNYRVQNLLLAILSTENYQIVDIDGVLLVNTIQKMNKLTSLGIGGRDALILETMDRFNVSTIATHDKNILKLNKYKRIDPVFESPLILEKYEEFNEQIFKEKMKEFTL
ncbi:MAG: PIN domain-containing protein [Candidatus Lokiarchaeota archaeon]|nr:PIN domain-containing protein [Candidatus Lokiarchaeota archaeon]MBD3201452.1 PIN domain-containing protein [Candidatus Lokiarchaeota archaeon]